MIDPNKHEQEAMHYAGQASGEYLDSIGKTDLAALTLEEWQTFIGACIGAYTEKLAELAASMEPPF